MAYFEDFSDYIYLERYRRPNTVNIGWLTQGKPFETKKPSENFLNRLWSYCQVSIAQTRGYHSCDLCGELGLIKGERHGIEFSLGIAEIRVFGNELTFAAPNLIYHYVEKHYYQPPQSFINAVMEGPVPPTEGYMKLLEAQNLSWDDTF